MFKNKSERQGRNGNVEEFTGFAWMREKKIHQKIGIRNSKLGISYNNIMFLFRL